VYIEHERGRPGFATEEEHMAEIRKLFWLRHLRAEATSHILQYRFGRLRRSGRGLAFWFYPMTTALAEVPVDDRDLNFIFKGRTRDHQEVTVQGIVTYRVSDAERLAGRVDFAIDLHRGTHLKQPLEQIALLLTGIAQQAGLQVIARARLAELMAAGFDDLVAALRKALDEHATLAHMGLVLENVRVDDLRPAPELDRALQTPTREGLQQQADEATFHRRALAVEKERAIAENELQTQVELARREEGLIAQRGKNARQEVEQQSEARRLGVVAEAEDERIKAAAAAEQQQIGAEAMAQRKRTLAAAEADSARLEAELAAERVRLEAAAAADRQRSEGAAQAEAARLIGAATAETTRRQGLAEAEKLGAVGEARARGERQRLDAYRDLPPEAVLALAAQELAGQLKIDNLTITPDMLGGLLEKAARLGVARLERGAL
jgi:regulator of protease activity HflC (stomatin/prohibitin superfamily)